jgi:hypothetical protein
MFGSAILDVAIGIVFIYVVLSMMCSAIREGLEAFIKSRSAALEYGIRELLHEVSSGQLTEAIYNHPEIYGMFAGSYQRTGRTQQPWWFTSGKNLPSYIPSRSFALALMDLIARGPVPVAGDAAAAGGNAGGNADGAANGMAMNSDLFSLPLIRANIRSIQNPWVERALLTALDTAGADLNAAIRNVEAWYDNAMDRVSGRYRRSSQFVLFLIGLVIAAGFNINTLEIADYLYRNPTERAALVAKAAALSQTPGDANHNFSDVLNEVQSMRFPVGWPAVDSSAVGSGGAEFLAWTLRGFGWLLTAFAVTLGAPFWFDVLNRIMLMRSTVKPADVKTQPAAPAAAPDSDAGGFATASVSGVRPVPAGPDDGTGLAAVVPVSAGAPDPDACTDGCEVSIASPTEDADLPAAQGGVA